MPSVNISQIAASDVAIAENRETLSSTLTKYGSSAQISTSLEEIGGLVQAIARTQLAMKGSADIHESVQLLSEEMADVKIMLSQLTMIFDNDLEVARIVHEKCEARKQQLETDQPPSSEEMFGEDWEIAISS